MINAPDGGECVTVARAWSANTLDRLYLELNRREYVHPDPLEFLYGYATAADREVVALVAGSLAYGRVKQILRSVSVVLDMLGPCPAAYIMKTRPSRLGQRLAGFKHRFTTGEQMAALLTGAGRIIADYGSLHACFGEGAAGDGETVLPALGAFVAKIAETAGSDCGHLLPDPARGSACKRLNLMLRWLVRRDDVDPGGWTCVRPEQLVVPLDTHMHRIALAMGLTKRKAGDIRTALEVTNAFRHICPTDPVKYDFALTRLGIRDDVPMPEFLTGNHLKGAER